MPHKNRDLDAHKDQITQWVREGISHQDIIGRLEMQLQTRISRGTLCRRLREWAVRTNHASKHDERLKARLKFVFENYRLKDSGIIKMLRDEGFQLSERSLLRMRLTLGLRKRRAKKAAKETVQRALEAQKQVQPPLEKGPTQVDEQQTLPGLRPDAEDLVPEADLPFETLPYFHSGHNRQSTPEVP